VQKSVRPRMSFVFIILSIVTLLPGLLGAATFTVINNADSGAGSLRQAILDANATAGTDTIAFAIPGAGVHTIAPLTNLPTIVEAVFIDGYTQPGSSANTLAVGSDAVLQIELTGTGVPSGTGLNFNGLVDGATVRGLVVNKWNNGITFAGTKNSIITGCFIGTNAAGTAALGNSNGLFILSSAQQNTFGGPSPAARNVISGNTSGGIIMGNSGTSFNVIENSYIGTNAAGTAGIPNLQGISFNSPDHDTIRNNVISGNIGSPSFSAGISIINLANHITVTANKIGVAANGTTPLPNVYGIILSDGFSGGANDNTIGTFAQPNVIAFNTAAGITMKAQVSKQSHNNAILYNSIFGNGALGIDLGDDGVTANDVGDGDTGLFNDLQNFPVLSSAQFGAGTVTINGSISSQPSTSYEVQFFQSTTCDASGNGEGQTYLGEATVVTDPSGVGAFNVNFPGIAGGFATATATDPLGNTSEFSACAAITTPLQPQISISDPSVIEGDAGTTKLAFNITLSAASALPVSVDYTTNDITASSASDYVADSNVFTIPAGTTSQVLLVTVNTDVTVEGDETMRVDLTNPTNATILDPQGIGTILNDDGLSSLSIGDVPLSEGNGPGTTSFVFTVTLSAASAFPVTVNYATADGAAVSPGDYQAASGVLTFTPGQTTQTITVLVNGDTTNEPSEAFVVNLFNAGNASISDNQATGTILNDDPLPTITINDPSKIEGNSGSASMQFVITLSNPSSQTLSVPFSLADGTANVGVDYQTNSGSFTVLPGATTASLSIGIFGDVTVEPDETFFVNLGATANAIIGDSQGVGTIINDDGLPQPGIGISDVPVLEGNSGTVNANFNVTLTASSILTVTVNYTTANNTATSGSDYVAKSGTVTFTPGQTSQQVTIVVNGDVTVEPNETFFVNLSGASNGLIIDSQGVGTINNDDIASADLSIAKNGPASATTGTNIPYTILVTNNGLAAATGVTVTDVLPAGSSFVSAIPTQGSCSGTSTVTCSLGGLANGAGATVTLTIQAPSSGPSVTNTATVTAVEVDPVPLNNSAGATTTLTSNAIPALSLEALLLLCALLGAAAVWKLR
jgi:uncharacterized repeat protein (TIGR01451 family)